MPASTWTTAGGVAALVVTGAALVAVASTDSPEPTASTAISSEAPSAAASPSSSPEPSSATEPSRSVAASPSISPDSTVSAVTVSSGASMISAERARQIAAGQLMTVGDLVLAEIDLKPEDGRMIWDVEFAGDHEVEIDAVTAAVLEIEIGGRVHVNDDNGTDDRGDDRGDDHGDDNDDNSGSGSDDHGRG
jgi:hypothetical protein